MPDETTRPTEAMAISITHCARCHQDHDYLWFERFGYPVIDGDGTVWDWWALCPVTHEPVLMRAWPVCDKAPIPAGTT